VSQCGLYAIHINLLLLREVLGATRESQRYQSLSLFNTVHGIGPSSAQKLYDLGLRTIEDLERYYDVPPGAEVSEVEALFKAPDGRLPKDKIPLVTIPVALVLRKELNIKIPKEEVLEIHKLVMGELQEIQKGCISTIVGGYVSISELDLLSHSINQLSPREAREQRCRYRYQFTP